MTFSTVGFELEEWQRAAVEAWVEGEDSRPFRGTLEIFTGGGKTLIALTCAARGAAELDHPRLVVVVPTEALARQWIESIARYTTLERGDIGLLGAGGSGDLHRHRALVAVLNSAAKKLPDMVTPDMDVILIVDECHRAGAPTFSKVLDTRAKCRLGLSATPDREEFDDEGMPLRYDEQVVGRKLGRVVYRFDLKDARLAGWLPEYRLHHHGIPLLPDERKEYDSVSRRIDDLTDELLALGIDVGRARSMQDRQDEVGQISRAFVATTSMRKDLLYRAGERHRITLRIVRRALRRDDAKVLLFHERVDEAVQLFEALSVLDSDTRDGEPVPASRPMSPVRLEHSRLPDAARIQALNAFRTGEARVLVSVKSLIEGIDVPDADVGISVASSASVRQRVQSLGRVLRRRFDESAGRKVAEMHVLYVSDSVDESIYAKEDWSDLTGADANRYWRWSTEPDAQPERMPGPPASPRPTEDQAWEALGRAVPENPVRWEGNIHGQEFSVDTMGTVTNFFGTVIANPQDVGKMVETVRERAGGRFWVTPEHHLVLVTKGDGTGEIFLAGQLAETFEAVDDETVDELDEGALLEPGKPYGGPTDKAGGTFQLRQKRGGVIERKVGKTAEFALTEGSDARQLEVNAESVLSAWRSLLDRGITFHVNERGHAWYLEQGRAHFLAEVPGGFAWPPAEG